MRYVFFILCTFIFLSSRGYADLQEGDPFRDTIEPGFGNFDEWEKNLDLAPIYYELSPFVPEGYIITALESSCWYDSKYPQFWIIGMSYHHPVFYGGSRVFCRSGDLHQRHQRRSSFKNLSGSDLIFKI